MYRIDPTTIEPLKNLTVADSSFNKNSVSLDLLACRYACMLAVTWTICIIASLLWNIKEQKAYEKEIALNQAVAAFETDIAYRRWNAKHGGVYAPLTEDTPPNTFMNVPERDIETPSGRKLTLINHAYMIRQTQKLSSTTVDIVSHIASLNPIQPQNKADAWEKEALQSFERGTSQKIDIIQTREGSYLRFMHPLVTEKSCLKCHANHGYKEGDIQGGISVTVPLASIQTSGRVHIWKIFIVHVVLWLVGIVGILLVNKQITQKKNQLYAVLQKSEECLRHLSDNIPGGAVYQLTHSAEGRRYFTYASNSFKHLFDLTPEQLRKSADPLYDMIHSEDTKRVIEAEKKALESDGILNFEGRVVLAEKDIRWFQWCSKPKRCQNGSVTWDGVVLDITDRKQFEERLKLRTIELDTIFKNVPIIIMLVNKNGLVVNINMMGSFSQGEEDKLCNLPGGEVLRCVNAFSEKGCGQGERCKTCKIRNTVMETFRTGNTFHQVEGQMTVKNNDKTHNYVFLISTVLLKTPEEKVLVCVNDVTERKLAEEALRESKERFQQVAEHAQEWIWEVDLHGRYIYSSPTVEVILGYKPEDIVGKKYFYDLYHPDQKEELNKMTFKMFAQKRPFRRFVNRNLHMEGRTVWLSTSGVPILDKEEKLLGYRGVTSDITERKHVDEMLQRYYDNLEELVAKRTAELLDINFDLENEIIKRKKTEQALRESEGKLNSILLSITDYMTMIDSKYTIVWANEAVKSVFGDDIVGKKCYEAYYKFESKCEPSCICEKLWKDGGVCEGECLTSDKDGRKIILHTTSSVALRFMDGTPQTIVKISRDITKSKEYEQKLESAYEDMEKTLKELKRTQEQLVQSSKLRSLGELAAGIAHEVNQPLSGISMGLENIIYKVLQNKADSTYLKNKCEVILSYVERIKHIIEHVRIFSREQKSTVLEVININQAIQNALGLIKTQYQAHNIIIQLDMNDDLRMVKGNLYKFEQVVLNFFSNAKDAVDTRATECNDDYHKVITIRTFMESSNVCMEIQDNGIGIPVENLGKIFDPFFTTKSEKKGMGMGLSISYGIIKEMEGEVFISSQVNEYTRIKIAIPEYHTQ